MRRANVQFEARRLRDLLAMQICRGEFESELLGEQAWLPSESDLMRAYGCSRAAVREALSLLRHEGMLDRLQGRGTLVLGRPRLFELRPPPGAQSSLQRGEFGPVASLLLDKRLVALPAPVAAELEVAPGSEGLLFDSLFVAGSEPLAVVTNYLRAPEAYAVAKLPVRDDYYALLSDAGISIGLHDTVSQPKVAEESIAALLTVPVGTPVTWTEERLYSSSGALLNFSLSWSRGDIVRFRTAFPHPVSHEVQFAAPASGF